MTYARLLATGSGSRAVRVMIEGLPYEFVSDPGMEKTTDDGRVRIYCLEEMGKGITIAEKVNIPEAKLEAEGSSLRLYERQDEAVSKALAWQPSIERFISTTIDVGDTSVTLTSADGISAGDVVHVGTEAMKVTAVGTGSIDVTRAYWDTTAQKHWSNEGGIPQRKLVDRPRRARGRRAYVYLYGDGDDLAGDGTRVWIGQVTSEPRVTDAGEVWMLQLASIAKRLDGKWGGGLDVPRQPRGIYYPWSAGIWVQINENATATPAFDIFHGFYETQREFVEEFTTFLADLKTTYSLASTYRAVETDDGRWTVEVVVGASITQISVDLRSLQDGNTSPIPDGMRDSDGNPYDWGFSAEGNVIRPSWLPDAPADARLVPRGYFGVPESDLYSSHDEIENNPARRIYIAGPIDAGAWSNVSISWPGSGADDAFSRDYAFTSLNGHNGTDNWVNLQQYGGILPDDPPERYGAYTLPSIQATRTLALGSLADLRDALVTDAPLFCNRGTSPFLTSDDIADWTDVVAQATTRGWLTGRYWAASKPVDTLDLLTAEMQLLGVFPIIDADGKIAIQTISVPNSAIVNAITIDDEIISVGWSDLERGGQTINRVVLKTGYSPKDDKWNGVPYDVLDVDAYAEDHVDRSITVEPRSYSVYSSNTHGFDFFNSNDVAEAFGPLLGLFGAPYDIVTVNVSWKLFGTLLGDFVSFSAIHLPDATAGVRPMSNVGGVVIGRKWDLGEAHGTLTILLTYQNVSGYAPTARVTATENKDGNTWILTVDATKYAPDADHNADTFFAKGDAVRIVEYDSESPTVITGAVDGVNTSAHKITVTFVSAFSPGTKTWNLSFDSYDNVEDSQQKYCFMADATALLDGDNARTYAP